MQKKTTLPIDKIIAYSQTFDTFAAIIIMVKKQYMKIIFSTGNSCKLREASEILGKGFELVTPADMGLSEDIPETGNTLRANSLIKAQYIYDRLGSNCFADDTGLEVDILGGAPGVQSARYSGQNKDFNDNMAKLLREMAIMENEASMAREYGINTCRATRKATFRTVITLILNGEKHFFEGVMEGKISISRAGEGGFGYDAIFIPDELPQIDNKGNIINDGAVVPNTERLTAAEISEEQKNAISHRGKALRAMANFLKDFKSGKTA